MMKKLQFADLLITGMIVNENKRKKMLGFFHLFRNKLC